jgi:hypothetical protein
MATLMRSRGGSPQCEGHVSPILRRDGRARTTESASLESNSRVEDSGAVSCDIAAMTSDMEVETDDSIVGRRLAGRLRRGVGTVNSGGPECVESMSTGPSPFASVSACAGADSLGSCEREESIVSRRRNGNFARGRGFVDFGSSEALEGVLVGDSPFELGGEAREGLVSAFAQGQPVLIKGGVGAAGKRELVESWARYVETDGRRNFTINPVKSDAGPGEDPPHARSGLSLQQIWNGRCRLETQLGRGLDGSPVHEWLSSRDGALVSAACALEAELSSLGRQMCDGGDGMLRPSFVLGSVYARGGGPTHYDTYHSWAMLLVGRKTFYVLPHKTLRKSRGGKPHERTDVNPSHRRLPWRRFDLDPGDVFFLPAGWWHFVVSDPQTIMTNSWVYPRDGDNRAGFEA